MFSFEGTEGTGLDSSMVEHAAVNRGVAGSSPARGASETAGLTAVFLLHFILVDIGYEF